MTDDGERLVRLNEAAAMIKRPRGTVAHWHAAGVLVPADWYGRHPLFRPTDVRAVAARMDASRMSRATRKAMSKVPTVARNLVPATEPTDTRPGSAERMKVYEERVARNQAVFHAADTRIDRTAA